MREPNIVVRKNGEGSAIWSMGQLYRQKLTGEDSAGEVTILEVMQPSGLATPQHIHPSESEVFYMLEGQMTYRTDEETHELTPGSMVYLPRGVPHAFRTRSLTRILAIVLPAGLEFLYRAVGRPAESTALPPPPTEEELQAWVAEAVARGMQIVGPPIPE